jgi:uncharacterized membrane protein YdbT with pleckstrin-like domain
MDEYTFRGQREDETVIVVTHSHPWALVRPGLWVSLGLIIIALMFVWFQASPPTVWTMLILGPICLIYGLYAWFMWWNTMYLLTNQRVIAITQRGLWSRRIEDYSLDKIQSVASEISGLAGTMLNFGAVLLAIIGMKDQVNLSFVEDPRSLQEKILAAIKGQEQVTINEYHQPKNQPKKHRIQH